MIERKILIGSTPTLLIGDRSERVFLFMHGLHGHKEEALAFAKVAVPRGYQVLGIDVPVERRPWEVMPMLSEVRDYLYKHWPRVSIRANSIGAWFSLLTFQGKEVGQALFVSPILDMKKFIELMPQRKEDYYEWVINHPITRWNAPTYILRPEVDMIVSEEVNHDFIRPLIFVIRLMLGLMKLAGAYDFLSAFALSYCIWLFIGWYDCFFLDWVLFANMKSVRLPGTEHMDSAYHQKRYHFVQSLRGMLIGLIPCLIGAGIYAYIV